MVDELWTIISESFSHCCPMATQGVWKLKNSKATNLEVVWQGRYKPRQLPCDLFLSVTFLLFLFFPVGSIRSMKEAKCTCLGAAVIWNPIPSLGALTKTFPCAAFFVGANYCWEKGSLGCGINHWASGYLHQWPKYRAACPVNMACVFSPLCLWTLAVKIRAFGLHHLSRQAALGPHAFT